MTTAGLKVCGQCGHMNPPDARFCNQCGKGIDESAQRPHYTPRHLSEKILQSRSAMEGERKQVTVLFVDVKGSVALSRQVDPEQWHRILDRFFALLTDNVHRYEGTVNQYTGDGIMALFGAPIAHEDHAVRACRAALDIQRDIRGLAEELHDSLGIDFRVRQGLNSGQVVVGRIGDDLRMDYTAKGQTVGLAARMEQLAQPNTILLSEYSRALVEDAFEMAERGSVSIKGFSSKIRSYELLRARRRAEPEESEDLPLIGRERELNLLAAYRAQVVNQGRGLLVTISADTGLGKSRLCREFMRRCREQEVHVFGVHGSSHHRADPLAPVCELFASYFGLEPDMELDLAREQVQQRLQPFAPLPPMLLDNLDVLLGLQEPEAGTDQDVQLRIELALSLMLRLMREGAFNHHLVCVIENIHWLDDARSRPLLDAMVGMLAHAPVLVLMSARSDYVFPWQEPRVIRNLVLQPLAAAQSAQFLDALIGSGKELESLRQAIIEQAGGNPMFIVELVEQLLASGVLEREGRRVKLKKQPGEIRLPPSVQAVVAARIDALPEAAKRLLQTAAVIGRRVPLELLDKVHGAADIGVSLDLLKRQRFLQRDVGPDSRSALLFSQSLFQVVAYEALLGEQRREIHRRVAAAMAEAPRQDSMQLAQLAWHHAEAGETESAVAAYLGSAECGARTDLQDALRRLDRARELLRELDTGAHADLRLRVLSRWLQYAARCGIEKSQLAQVSDEAEALARGRISLENRLLMALGQSAVALASSDPGRAVAVLEGVRESARESGEPALQLLVLVPLVYSELALGRLSSALRNAEDGLWLCADDSETGAAQLSYSPYVALSVLKAWISLWLGRAAQAASLARHALDTARLRRHNEQVVMAQAALAYVLAESGEADEAQDLAAQAMQQAQGLKNPVAELLALMAYGRALIRAGQPTEALVALEDGLARGAGQAFGLGETGWLEADMSLAQLLAGNGRGAREAAQRAVRQADESGAQLAQIQALLAQIRSGLYASRPLGYLKRYQAPLKRSGDLIDSCEARLLHPEWLLLKARFLSLRQQDTEAAPLREKAGHMLEEFGLQKPPLPEVGQD